MFSRGDLVDWNDTDIVELWRERVAMRLMPITGRQETVSDVRQAEYLAAKEIRQWVGKRQLPHEILQCFHKLRQAT
jgi:hypothetical protein